MDKLTVNRFKAIDERLLNIIFRLSFIKKLSKSDHKKLKTMELELNNKDRYL